jgi:hypothetical protein
MMGSPVTPESVQMFSRGFAIQPNPIVDLSTGTRAGQLQEFIVLDNPNDPAALIAYYSAWSNGAGDSTAIWRCTGTKAAPSVWSNHTEVLTADDAGMDYVRLGSVTWDGSTYRFFLSGGADGVYRVNSADGIDLSATPVSMMTQAGQGAEEAGAVSLFAAIIIDGTHWGVYTVDSATPSARFRLATSPTGDTWTKTDDTILAPGGSGPDSGGFEWHFLNVVGTNLVMSYEAWNGVDAWTGNIAYAPLSGFTGTWAKLPAPVLVADPESTFAQVNVATPSFRKIAGTWYTFFQGVNEVPSVPTGNGGPWKIGIAALNPA